MKSLVFLLLLAVASAKVYERCELASAMKDYGLAEYWGISLDNWVCLAQHESRFDTKAINRNRGGSTDYGIFQINNRWWCSDGKYRSYNTCKISCNSLLSDDIYESVECAKIIVRSQGITAWVAWNKYCSDRDLSSYTSDCDL